MIQFLDIQKITHSFQPSLSEAVQQVVESGWYLHGAATAAFERDFAAYCQRQHCVGVANGLDALYLVLAAKRSLDASWHDGDEIIVPAMTFIATAEAVTRAGLTPVLVDVGPDALVDPQHLEAALTPRTRGIVPVHLYGQTAAMEAVSAFAQRHGLFVLEDAAQAHGGVDVTRYGHASTFSFYPGKNLGALGDGGAVVTDDPQLAERVRAFANYGAARKYHHEYQGCNSRLDELQAAVLSVKLKRLDLDNDRRRAIAQRYFEGIKNPTVKLLPTAAAESVWHIFPVFSEHRTALQQYLEHCGVETITHYPLAVHQQPCMQGHCRAILPLSNAEQIAAHELSLPISPIMTHEEVETVINAVNSFGK